MITRDLKNFCRLPLMCVVLVMVQCNHSPGKYPVTLLGLDDSGKEFHHVVASKYGKNIGDSLDDISEEAIKVLDDHWENSPWELDRIDMGLGLTAKLGFAMFSFETSPSFRLTFLKK